jgi:hypothetical protein
MVSDRALQLAHGAEKHLLHSVLHGPTWIDISAYLVAAAVHSVQNALPHSLNIAW